jgi:hypothetical protein
MAFPTATVSQGLAQTASATGDRNVTVPTCAAGDLLIAVVSSDGNPNFSGTLTTNMTSFVAKAANGTAVTSQCFYRICDGSETSPWVLNLSASEAASVAFILIPAASWHGTTPPEGVAWVNVDTANPNPPNLDPSGWAAEDTLWIAVATYDLGTQTVTAYPTNYADDQTNVRGNNTGGVGIGIATRGLNASAEDPGTFTLSATEDTLTTTIAVRPAAGGATFALAGTAAATATMTGAVTHSYALAGTAPAVASLAGAVAIAYPLAGLAAATASMTGAITHSYTLAGTAAATANMTGDATVAGGGATFALSGFADATASMSGAVGIAYGLAGEAQASASMTGALTHAYGLAGEASASASMTGAISHVYGLAGIAASVATLVGDLTLEGLSVDGDADLDFPDIFSATFASSSAYAAVLTFSSQYEATLAEMATEQDLNDTARPTVTFSVDGTPTDPTTVSLLVEKPDKTRTTYTYAQAQITKSGTGVYYRDVSLDAAGNWRFVFTGTGACAASVEGVVTVVG